MKNKTILASLITAFALSCVIGLSGFVRAENTQEVADVSPSSLWEIPNGVTIENNVDVPSYVTSGLVYDETQKKAVEFNPDSLADWQKNGVKITSLNSRNPIRFKNYIDVSKTTKDDVLLEFCPIIPERGLSVPFGGLEFVLTDAENPNKFVEIEMTATNLNYGAYTRLSVTSSANPNPVAYRWGGYHKTPSTLYDNMRHDFLGTIYASWWGEEYAPTQFVYVPFSLRYDAVDKAIWINRGDKNLDCLADLDDPDLVGTGIFDGFDSGRISLSIRTYNITGSAAEMILLNCGGLGMNGNEINDTTAPVCIDDVSALEYPVANVGKKYVPLPIKFYDLVEGYVDCDIFVKDASAPESSFVKITDAFIPEKVGKYTLKYKAADGSGNVCVEYAEFDAVYASSQITIELNGNDERVYGVGEKITLPEITACGGYGKLTTEIALKNLNSGDEEKIENSFVPYTAGNYVVVITVTDYNGNNSSEILQYSVVKGRGVVIEKEISLNKRVKNGVEIKLPELEAWDYESSQGQKLKAIVDIVARGTGVKSDYKETVENGLFVPDKAKFGDSVIIEYKAHCAALPQVVATRTYSVEISDLTDVRDLFFFDDSVTAEVNAIDDESKYAAFIAANNGTSSFEFINPLYQNEFLLTFSSTNGKKNFESFDIKLKDAAYGNLLAKISVYEKDGALIAEKDGVTAIMSGVLDEVHVVTLSYNANGYIQDGAGNELFPIDIQATDSRVRCELSLVNAKVGARIRIHKLFNQQIAGTYRSGKLTSFKDNVKPTIVLSERCVPEVEINEKVRIPYAKAFDECTTYMKVSYTLTAPDGQVVINEKEVGQDDSFVADKCGVWTIAYKASDGINTRNETRTVNVIDRTKPIIDYGGKTSLSAKIGQILSIPKVNVYDVEDSEVNLKVYVITSRGDTVDVTNKNEYEFKFKGKHTLRYYAYDKSFNCSFVDVVITVE